MGLSHGLPIIKPELRIQMVEEKCNGDAMRSHFLYWNTKQSTSDTYPLT